MTKGQGASALPRKIRRRLVLLLRGHRPPRCSNIERCSRFCVAQQELHGSHGPVLRWIRGTFVRRSECVPNRGGSSQHRQPNRTTIAHRLDWNLFSAGLRTNSLPASFRPPSRRSAFKLHPRIPRRSSPRQGATFSNLVLGLKGEYVRDICGSRNGKIINHARSPTLIPSQVTSRPSKVDQVEVGILPIPSNVRNGSEAAELGCKLPVCP